MDNILYEKNMGAEWVKGHLELNPTYETWSNL